MLIESLALGLVCGAACYSQFSQVIAIKPIIEIALLFSLVVCFYACCVKKLKLGTCFYFLVIFLGFIFELGLANYQAQKILAWRLPDRYHNQVVELRGSIMGVPFIESKQESKQDTHKIKLIFLADELCLKAKSCESLKTPQRIKLYGELNSVSDLILQPGDRLYIKAKIKQPWGLSNPGGFDAEKNYFFNQIKATGSLLDILSRQKNIHTSFQESLDKLRQKISDQMLNSLDQDKLSGMLIGLTIGVSDRITQEQWSLLRQTGTIHLIAISGLHISLIGGLIFGLMNFFWRRVPRLLLWMPAKIAAAYLTILFTWAYGFLAGMSLATERACLMMTVFLLAIILKLRLSPGFVFAFSMVVILLWDPFAVLSIGFWLSYLAIGILIFATSNRVWLTPQTKIAKIFQPQWVVFLGMLPVSLYFFQSTSLISPLVNLIAIPWVSFIVTPLCLLSAFAFMLNMPWLGKPLVILAKYLYWPLWASMEWITSLYPVMWNFALPSGLAGLGLFALSMLGVGILLLPRGVPFKNILGGILAALILFYKPIHLQKGEFQFGLLDVGQGLASVIFTQNHVLIYDTGPKWKENDSGAQIIQPFLDYYHIKKIDVIIISHTDLDHRGGLDSILANYPVDKLLTSEVERLFQKSMLQNKQPILCQKGQSWEWDGVYFELLHPTVTGIEQKNRNNLSCVLKVTSGQSSVLLTGDIEAGAELELVNNQKSKLASNIVIAPHHGSQTSSTPEFIQAVQPDYVLFPIGKDNRFGFPRQPVLERYSNLNSKLYDTADRGAVIFNIKPNSISKPITWRDKQARFWHSGK